VGRGWFFVVAVAVVCSVVMISPAAARDMDVPKGPIDIIADSISYDEETETYRAEGDVVIAFSGGNLKADRVTLHSLTKVAVARGNVSITSDGDVVEGDYVRFNVASKTGSIREGRIFFSQNHLYISGSDITKTGEKEYSITDARATTCDGDIPDWRFTGKKLNVTIDGYGTVTHGTFQVKNVPVLYAPYFIFPAKTTRQTGLLIPRVGHSGDKLGTDVEIPFYWAISEHADATFYQRYMSKRGFQEGAELRYFIGEHSFGTIYGDFLNDTKDIGSDERDTDQITRDWEENNNRWTYYINHETHFGPRCYIRSDIKKVSDPWYFRDFDSHNYYRDHAEDYGADTLFGRVSFAGDKAMDSLESTVRFVKKWDLYNLTVFGRYTDDFRSYSNDQTLQTYPRISLTGVQQPLFGTPLTVAFDSSYTYYYRTVGLGGHVGDIHPVVMLPVHFDSYLDLVLTAGVRETMWDSSYHGGQAVGSDSSRALYHAGAAASTEIHRIFTVNGDIVQKIRHSIIPEVAYRYTPFIEQSDLPDFVSAVAEESLVEYSLTNTLTSRSTTEDGARTHYREFFFLKLSQAYDIKESRRNVAVGEPERRPFGPVEIETRFDPCSSVTVAGDLNFDVDSGEWKKTNYDMILRDIRGDALSAQYRYTQDDTEEFNLDLTAVITDAVAASYTVQKNILDDNIVEVTYGVEYKSQCWSMELSYADSPDDRRYMAVFYLYGFGKVGETSGGFD